MGEEYDPKWATASQPLYTVVPNSSVFYKYCTDEPLEQFAKKISVDFHAYAVPFYEKYDTVYMKHGFDKEISVGSQYIKDILGGRK